MESTTVVQRRRYLTSGQRFISLVLVGLMLISVVGRLSIRPRQAAAQDPFKVRVLGPAEQPRRVMEQRPALGHGGGLDALAEHAAAKSGK